MFIFFKINVKQCYINDNIIFILIMQNYLRNENPPIKRDTPSPIRRFIRMSAVIQYIHQHNNGLNKSNSIKSCSPCKLEAASHFSQKNSKKNFEKSKSTHSSACVSPALFSNRRKSQSISNNDNNDENNNDNNFKTNKFETKFCEFSERENLHASQKAFNSITSKLF